MSNLYLSDIKDLIKTAYPTADVYAGSIDNLKDKAIGVFRRTKWGPVVAIGGMDNSSYNTFSSSILIRWTESTLECEIMANDIYNYFVFLKNQTVNGKRIIHSYCENDGPIDLSRGERNICEMVVHTNFYYER